MSQMTSTHPTPATVRAPLPPGPRGQFFWGSLKDLQRDMLGLYRSSAREYGDVVRLKFAGVDTYTVSHPNHFKYILQDNHKTTAATRSSTTWCACSWATACSPPTAATGSAAAA